MPTDVVPRPERALRDPRAPGAELMTLAPGDAVEQASLENAASWSYLT